MKSLIIYDSQYGNTELIANAVAQALQPLGDTLLLKTIDVLPADFVAADLIAVGGPTQGHGISPKLAEMLDRLPADSQTGKSALAFDTRLHMVRWLTGAASGIIAHKLQRLGCTMLAPGESFIVSANEGPLQDGELERAGIWATRITENLRTAQPTTA
jgi:flavodoxin